MIQRRKHYQVIINNSATLYTDGPVVMTETIESCVTYVAQFTVWATPTINSGDAIEIRQYDRNVRNYIPMFKGKVNRKVGTAFPHLVTIYCVGPLADLQFVRREDDLDLSGMTDGAAVKAILTYCGIPYNNADIQDAGYVLGAQEPVYWRKDETAMRIIQEIDRAVFMTTKECYAGRVIRYAYTLSPTSDMIYATYQAGETATFYGDERDLGDLSEIRNIAHVTGASFPCGTNDECTCTVWAHAEADHAKFGEGKRTQTNDFSSELIQDEALARFVVRRLMRAHNRDPDRLRIETANDPIILPGRVIGAIDPTYGIDLATVKPYTVVSVQREDDFMVLDCVGGENGAVGTVTSGVEKECNETRSNVSIPGSFTDPPFRQPPTMEPIPGQPDIPDEDINTTDAFLDCTASDGMAGFVDSAYIDENGFAQWQYVENSSWRISTGSGVSAKVGAGGIVEEIVIHQDPGTSLVWNETPGFNSDKNTSNDNLLGTAPAFTISGEVWFASSGDYLMIELRDGIVTAPVAILYASPGLSHDGHTWSVRARGENQPSRTSDSSPPGSCPHVSTNCNNGGYMGKDSGGFPLNEWISFTVSFDITGERHRVYVSTSTVSGYFEDLECWGPSCQFEFINEPCEHEEHRVILSTPSATGWTEPTNPRMRLRLIGMGHTTCEHNPDFIPPER